MFFPGVLFLENNDMRGALPTDFGTLDWSKLNSQLRAIVDFYSLSVTNSKFPLQERLHLDGNQFEGPIPPDMFKGKSRFGTLASSQTRNGHLCSPSHCNI